VVALELPGHGESDDLLKAGKPSIVAYAKIIDAALEELDLSDVDVIGLGAGAVIGLELALLNRARVHALAMVGVAHIDPDRLPDLLEKIAPPIEPDWFGGHLLQAWYVVRDHALFWPWYERTSGGVVLQEPQVEPARLQQRVLELFRSRGSWGRTLHAQFAYPLHAKLTRACGRAALPIVFAASDLDPQRDQTWRVAASVPQAARQQLPDAESKWATTLLAYFDGIR
jgi:pimeloyl-ACP methyl ester carboxylesterase